MPRTLTELLDLLANHEDAPGTNQILNALGVYSELRATPEGVEDARWCLECGLFEMGILPDPNPEG